MRKWSISARAERVDLRVGGKVGDVKTIRRLLGKCTQSQRKQIFDGLRAEFPIHALEADLGITAEMILEAIARSSDLVLRGIRGIIAEVAF